MSAVTGGDLEGSALAPEEILLAPAPRAPSLQVGYPGGDCLAAVDGTLRFVMPVLGHVLKDVPGHMLRHVPVMHVPGHMLEHMPKHVPDRHVLDNHVPKHVLARHVLGLKKNFKFFFKAKTVLSFSHGQRR